ncbi:hypothetical protein [Staphylococcus caledonicus]|uniref:hypothetical protein n=1 Tax=Staphylococcus caledonicus TaxID=2741333 RepID=UPI0018E4B5D6|nr:hypothetical protein [Staphylococcus caledonicus]MBI5973903.1 hypothetical protein [Staphylococcus caledonicus]
MTSKEKFKIAMFTLLSLIIIVLLLIISFFAAYTVFLSMLIALSTNTLNTAVCILGVFLMQVIGIFTWWLIKRLYRVYCNKTGFNIKKEN